MPLIAMQDVKKHYHVAGQAVKALDGVSAVIEKREYVAITGASGSGKSTLLNILGCLDQPTSGKYLLSGKSVVGLSSDEQADVRNLDVGFIFQSFNLLARATALRNVMQPLVYRKMRHCDRRYRATEALQTVGMADRMHHLPNQLSGGQQQRVAIARALVTQPSILLADEPTGNLDSTASGQIMDLFDAFHASGYTVVLVSHNPTFVDRSQRVLRLRDGRVHEAIFS